MADTTPEADIGFPLSLNGLRASYDKLPLGGWQSRSSIQSLMRISRVVPWRHSRVEDHGGIVGYTSEISHS
jgi:hypothetical protein